MMPKVSIQVPSLCCILLCKPIGIGNGKETLRTCILWRSMTAAESLLIGLGVLFTTTRNTHCSKLSFTSREVDSIERFVSMIRVFNPSFSLQTVRLS